MNSFSKILIFALSGFYLFLSTGVMLFQTHCLCSDTSRISLYAAADSCTEIFPDQNCCGENDACGRIYLSEESHSCGCEDPQATYLKLAIHVGEDSHLEYPFVKQFLLANVPEIESGLDVVSSEEPVTHPYYSPPENQYFGRYLINFLNQRKIALPA